MNPPMTPKAYADAVREALADLPAKDREALLEDLDDHLAEIAAEPGMPLEERLGTPEGYAAELRAAYGGRIQETDLPLVEWMRRKVTGTVFAVHGRLLRLPPYRQMADFAPDLRPAWWVLRGYAIAIFVLAPLAAPGFIPDNLAQWAFTLAVIWGSVWLGRRSTRTAASAWGRLLLLGVNALAVWVVLIAATKVPHSPSYVDLDYASAQPGTVWAANTATLGEGDVYNILPFAEDGTPLRNVRLYDQDGQPIMLNPEMYGNTIAIPCDGEPPIRNAYPLPLRSMDEDITEAGSVPPDEPTCVPSSAIPVPTPMATPEGPPSASPSPTPELTPEPTPKSPGTSRD